MIAVGITSPTSTTKKTEHSRAIQSPAILFRNMGSDSFASELQTSKVDNSKWWSLIIGIIRAASSINY